MFCRNCGHKIDAHATTCIYCGTQVSSSSQNMMELQDLRNHDIAKRVNPNKKVVLPPAC